ncbi:MAG: DUF4347 domain-containing protein [Janthinobacterium lividum]
MLHKYAVDQFVFEELELRILFSADTAVLAPGLTLADTTAVQRAPVQPASATQTAANGMADNVPAESVRHELIFIDGAVENALTLKTQLEAQHDSGRQFEVVMLDPTRDGITQISAVLNQRQDLDAVHIISHGSDGELQLGSTHLNNANLLSNALSISTWGEALASGGDILLYGCDVAQSTAGQQLVDSIGRLTGADIAASSNLTGNALGQGDWVLEYASGKIGSQVAPNVAIQSSYTGILNSYVVSNANDSGVGSLRAAITDANANAGSNVIQFATGASTITGQLVAGDYQYRHH